MFRTFSAPLSTLLMCQLRYSHAFSRSLKGRNQRIWIKTISAHLSCICLLVLLGFFCLLESLLPSGSSEHHDPMFSWFNRMIHSLSLFHPSWTIRRRFIIFIFSAIANQYSYFRFLSHINTWITSDSNGSAVKAIWLDSECFRWRSTNQITWSEKWIVMI